MRDFVNKNHIHIYAFSVNGQPLPSFPNFIVPSEAILTRFFNNVQSVVYPSSFIVNVNTNKFIQLTTGYIAENQFESLYQSFMNNPQVHQAID